MTHSETRAAAYRACATRAAEAAAYAARPGATPTDVLLAERAAGDLRGMASRLEALGEPIPALAQTAHAVPVVRAPAPASRPVSKRQVETRSRAEQMRVLAAASPFPLPEHMLADAISGGQSVEAFALDVADHCIREREIEETVARIVSFAPAASITPTRPSHVDEIARRFEDA